MQGVFRIHGPHTARLVWWRWQGAMGVAVATIHDVEMVHGDLTTSNFMVRGGVDGPGGNELRDLVGTRKGVTESIWDSEDGALSYDVL
jgi:hypothetical protein